MQPRYNHTIALTQEEQNIIEVLQEDKITFKEIFLKGLEYYAPKIPKKLLKEAKGVVK